MILKGKRLQEPNKTIIVIPRGDDDAIVFTAQAVLDMKQFEDLCPEPKAPLIMMKGGEKRMDVEDPRYIQAINERHEKRIAYIILKSLEATPELQWETVSISDPDSWSKYDQELKDSGFSQVEIQRIVVGVLEANSLSQAKIDRARESFLAGQARQNGLSFHNSDRNGTPSGELVNASE